MSIKPLKSFFLLFLASTFLPQSPHADITWPMDVSERRLVVESAWQAVLRLPKNQRPHIVLVLGGGGARGLSHIGVLRMFEQERIPIDEVVGVSVGALMGALYSAGIRSQQIEEMAQEIGWNKLTNFSIFRMVRLLLSKSLLSTSRMESYLKRYIGDKKFSDLPIPFSCVATDLNTGERVVFKEGSVATAARASATIPGIFTPVEYRQRSLVDGGLVDNLPVDIAWSETPNKIVIAVLPKAEPRRETVNSTFGALVRSVEIQRDVMLESKRKLADFLIEPNVGSMSIVDLDRGKESMEAGLLEARAQVLPLKELIIRRTFAMHVNDGGRR